MRPDPRRRMPRAMADVLGEELGRLAPDDPLSRLQAAWPELAGRQHAEHSLPARLRGDGAVVVRCASGALASELQLRAPQLKALIADTLGLNVELVFQGPGRRQ